MLFCLKKNTHCSVVCLIPCTTWFYLLFLPGFLSEREKGHVRPFMVLEFLIEQQLGHSGKGVSLMQYVYMLHSRCHG